MATKGWVRGRFDCRGSWCQSGSDLPWERDTFPYRKTAIFVIGVALLALTGCGLLSLHQFKSPGKDWQARTGQLMYRNSGMTVTGDVLVRFSKAGDFEMTFSKGPGVNLFTIQQDATYAHVTSSFSRLSWSGKPEDAPKQLRGLLSLREKLISSPKEKVIRQTVDSEKFVFRF